MIVAQDISARSPVSQTDSIPSRQSLDSRAARHPTHHRGAVNGNHFERPQRTEEEEEAFEDVGLNDDPKPKKKGIFSRFGDSSGEAHRALNWVVLTASICRVGRGASAARERSWEKRRDRLQRAKLMSLFDE
jgi:hypothetical protein